MSTVPTNVPVTFAVPLNTPVDWFKLIAIGEFEINVQTYGGSPPVLTRVKLYGWFRQASGHTAALVIFTGSTTLIEVCAVAVCGGVPLSLALTVKAYVPLVVGGPVMAPEVARDKPGGKEPPARLHDNVPIPADADSCWEYDFPRAAGSRVNAGILNGGWRPDTFTA